MITRVFYEINNEFLEENLVKSLVYILQEKLPPQNHFTLQRSAL